jgi:hypothetical protein
MVAKPGRESEKVVCLDVRISGKIEPLFCAVYREIHLHYIKPENMLARNRIN